MDDNRSKQPQVSVLVPMYNIGPFVERCARSLCEQTLQELEMVFLDDGSTDDTVAILERTLADYPARREQAKIIRLTHNRGIAAGRKDLLEAATGEYLHFVDGDDYEEPDTEELMYAKARECNADIVLCNYFYYQKEGYVVSNLAPTGEGDHGAQLREDTLNRKITHYLCSRLIRRGLFEENDIAWPVESIAEDLVIVTQVTYYARVLAYVARPLYHYCFNPNSYSRAFSEEKCVGRFNGNLANYEVLANFMRQHHLEERYERGIFINKVATRNCLLPLLGQRKYRKLFLGTFPEVNRVFLTGNTNHKPTYKERMWMACIWLGLYPKYKKFIFKHFLPGEGWYGKAI